MNEPVTSLDAQRPTIDELVLADEPESWAAAGFTVGDNGTCAIGTVRVRLVGRGDGKGFVSWSLRNIAPIDDIDGVATSASTNLTIPTVSKATHPCGATQIDHLVWLTPDGERTASAVTQATYLPVRRIRETEARGRPIRQRFFRLGDVILEVVSSEPPGAGPVRFFGIALVVGDLGVLAARYRDGLGEIRDAVQPGRQVATLRTDAFDISVPLLFMTPEPRGT